MRSIALRLLSAAYAAADGGSGETGSGVIEEEVMETGKIVGIMIACLAATAILVILMVGYFGGNFFNVAATPATTTGASAGAARTPLFVPAKVTSVV